MKQHYKQNPNKTTKHSLLPPPQRIFSMVEFNEGLLALVGKAQRLCDQISRQIDDVSKSRQSNGQRLRILEGEHDEEKERLVRIRSSISDMGDILSSLQRLRNRQRRWQEAAAAEVEESRARLMEVVEKHRGRRAERVIMELQECLRKNLKKEGDDGRKKKRVFERITEAVKRRMVMSLVLVWVGFAIGGRRLKTSVIVGELQVFQGMG